MARGLMPGVTHKLIPPGPNDPPISPTVAILHVAVSKAESLYDFFRYRSGGIESHFYINWRGKIEQYRNIFWEADANYRANAFAVSIETAGFGPGWWNPMQKRAIKRVLLWLNEETNGAVPLRVCPGPTEAGVGYHVQFGAPGPWTPVAKSCPGPNRIKQFNRWLTPWLNSNPQKEETGMAEDVWKHEIPGAKMPAQRMLRKVFKRAGRNRKMLAEIHQMTSEIHDAVVKDAEGN